jgi:hypothetical protein
MPNVNVYEVAFGKQDKFGNIGFIYRIEGFANDALVKIFYHQIGTLQMCFVLN